MNIVLEGALIFIWSVIGLLIVNILTHIITEKLKDRRKEKEERRKKKPTKGKIMKEINIFVKFGYENKDNNYYEFYNCKEINIEKIGNVDFLTFKYLGKRTKTLNKIHFPVAYTHFGIKEVE